MICIHESTRVTSSTFSSTSPTRSKQSLENMLCSLITQLYDRSQDSRKHLDFLYSCENKRKRPSIDSLRTVFEDMIRQAGEVWIILDALDECQNMYSYINRRPVHWVERILLVTTNLHFLVTSRPAQRIHRDVRKWLRKENIISIEEDSTRDDIRAYINARVRQNQDLARWRSRSEVQDEIERVLMEKSAGMFRWVSCQLDELQNCVDLPSLRLALRSLPKTLEETYARILATAPPQHLLQTRRILQFLLFSERPLLVEEAVDAVAVELEGSPRFHLENRFPRPEILLDYCSSLVAITRRKTGKTGDQTVIELQFAHLSIKEYLMSNQLDQHIAKDLEETAARDSIAEVCLAYLLELPHSLSTTEIRQSFPLAQYCAQYWASHVAFAESSSESVRTLMMELFSNQSAYETCYRLYDPERAWKDDGDEDRRGAPTLYYASLMGLTYPVQILIENGVDINEQAGQHGNAL